jgi:hypothetical protein
MQAKSGSRTPWTWSAKKEMRAREKIALVGEKEFGKKLGLKVVRKN